MVIQGIALQGEEDEVVLACVGGGSRIKDDMDQRVDVLTPVTLVWRLAMIAGLYVKAGVDHW